MSKTKPIKIEGSPELIGKLALTTHNGAAQADFLCGDDQGPVWNIEGGRIDAKVAVMRTPLSAWRVVMRLGDTWYEIGQIGRGDPVLEHLSELGLFTCVGPSPVEIAKEKELAAKRAKEEAEQQAYWDARRQRAVKAAERRQEREERNRQNARERQGLA